MNNKLTKTIQTLLALTVIIGAFMVCAYSETHYTREECKVVQKSGNAVTVEDGAGHLWSYEIEDVNELKIGNVVTLFMDNSCTDSIYDDVVINYKKIR